MSHPTIYSGGMNKKNSSESHQTTAAASRARIAVGSRSAETANRPEPERIETWWQVLESSFDKEGKFCQGHDDQGIALLETMKYELLREMESTLEG